MNLKKKFLLISLPFNLPNQRYYPAAYVAGIIKDAGWYCVYRDYNSLLYANCDQKIKDLWDGAYSGLLKVSVFKGIMCKFVDLLKNTLPNIIDNNNVDIVGITTSKYGRYFIEPFLEFYRSLVVQPPILFGGTDCFPIYYGKRYFNHKLVPNILLQGEAEVAFPNFLKQYEKTQLLTTNIAGFIYKDIDGNIVDTGLPETPFMPECKVVADFDVFNESFGDYDNTITSFTSRGCINKCAFCDAWMSSKIRYRNYNAIVQEILIQTAGKYSQRVSFRDPNLNTSISHIRKLSNAFISTGLNIKWGAMGCFLVDLPDDVIELMQLSGFINFMIGLESASPEVIQCMGKRYDINKAQDMVMRLTRRGIVVQLPLISGFPGETVIDFLTTVAFVLKHIKNSYIKFSFSNRCRLHEKAFINKFPQDFFINESNKSPDRWESSDSSNTYNVRELRASLLTLLIQDKMIYARNCKKNIEAIDFNGNDIAQELAELIYRLGVLTNSIEESLNILQNSANRTLLDSGIYSRQMVVDLTNWHASDKNGPQKKKILEYIFRTFDSLSDLLGNEQFLDIHHFRKELFGFSRYRKRDECEGKIEIVLVRPTIYDGGDYTVFYGDAYSISNICQVERVCAISGGHIIEFFCRLPGVRERSSRFYEIGAEVFAGQTGFWGKVKKSYYKNHGLKIVIFYDDSTMSSFWYSSKQIADLLDKHSENFEERLLHPDSLIPQLKIKLPVISSPIDIHQLCKEQLYISKESPKYIIDDVIMFDGTGDGDKFVAWGFSPPANVTWSISSHAKLQLVLDRILSNSHVKIKFDAVTRIASDVSDRDFYEVYINGVKCATFPITHQELNSYQVGLDEFAFNNGDVLNIEFVLSDKMAPSLSTNPSNIPKIGLKSLVVKLLA